MNKKKNNNMIYTIVVILLLVIVALGFFLSKNMWSDNNPKDSAQISKTENIKITIIDDKRCNNCKTDDISSKLQAIPTLSKASFEIKDFSDEGVKQMLKDNGVKTIPAIIFSDNKVESILKQNLVKLNSGDYSLQMGATFNPFLERSDRGFLVLEKDELNKIKDNSYIKGNTDAKITWIEYSDLECSYCAKLHNSGTLEDLEEKYGDDLNVAFNHFPLEFHVNAMIGAKILECVGEVSGTDKFYSLIKKVYSKEKSNKSFIKSEAKKLGVNTDSLEKCIDEDKYGDKIKAQAERGNTLFGITGTPGNILINNETLEYEIISGAYPTETFVEAIDRLLGK